MGSSASRIDAVTAAQRPAVRCTCWKVAAAANTHAMAGTATAKPDRALPDT